MVGLKLVSYWFITITVSITLSSFLFVSTDVLNFLDIVKSILAEYRIHNADVTLRYDANADDLIDVIEGNRAYIPCIYLLNKIGNFMPFYCIVVSFFVLKS